MHHTTLGVLHVEEKKKNIKKNIAVNFFNWILMCSYISNRVHKLLLCSATMSSFSTKGFLLSKLTNYHAWIFITCTSYKLNQQMYTRHVLCPGHMWVVHLEEWHLSCFFFFIIIFEDKSAYQFVYVILYHIAHYSVSWNASQRYDWLWCCCLLLLNVHVMKYYMVNV